MVHLLLGLLISIDAGITAIGDLSTKMWEKGKELLKGLWTGIVFIWDGGDEGEGVKGGLKSFPVAS